MRKFFQLIAEDLVLTVIFFMVVIIISSNLIFSFLYSTCTQETIVFTVKDKENVVSGQSSKYLIFTEKEVLQDSDSFWYWKWDSSDTYSKIEKGSTYRANVYGWRWPFFSAYRNIVSIEETK